jgi:hypothetical protein
LALTLIRHSLPPVPPSESQCGLDVGVLIVELMCSDGMGVGVMLEIARVLVERKQPFDNSVIFRTSRLFETRFRSPQSGTEARRRFKMDRTCIPTAILLRKSELRR